MNKLSVAFLWHMHQPMYKDLVTGVYHLPWVRLHSTYSYLDMASILDEFPQVKVTFNLTPSLIWQLLDISKGFSYSDLYLELSQKKANDLTHNDKCFILKNFFSCDLKNAISPLAKYKALFTKRDNDLREESLIKKVKSFSTQDFRDLQVLFNLAWCGFTLRDNDKLIKELIAKGSYYTEDEKASLLEKQLEVVRSIIPLYRRLQDEGRIEISTSPFYHPILPILCDDELLAIADIASSGGIFLEDAKIHIERAVNYYKEVFGKKPIGMWPSEGGVSQNIISLLHDQGIKWIATDEAIVLESLKDKNISREDLIYNAYTAMQGTKGIDMVFRDINISNAVSFRYSSMPGKKAVLELVNDIKGIQKAMDSKEGDHVAAIILDGENPWPYYAEGGRDFLKEMYKELTLIENIKLVKIGEYLNSCESKTKITNLAQGSWINCNFNKWIGSPQKNKAWNYLKEAKKEIANSKTTVPREVLEELYIAEGSDWFWWYDEFGSELNLVFDKLFRMHLANIYTLLKKEVPSYLIQAIPSDFSVHDLGDTAYRAEMAPFKKILFVSSEVVPFAKTGGLADVSSSLPKALASLGIDVRVIMPLYQCVNRMRYKLTQEAKGIKHNLLGRQTSFSLYSYKEGGVTTYFIKKRRYFSFRRGLYGTSKGDYPDNATRYAFFSSSVLAAIKAINYKPDIIHCNDWQTALIPFYLRFKLNDGSFYKRIKTLFTIHNLAYQGIFEKLIMRQVGIPDGFFNMNDLEFYGKVNFMKSGITYSDMVNTVSRKYAEEIMTPEYGYSLDGLIRTRKDTLYGILNGADYSIWSPEIDRYIKSKFTTSSLEGKVQCKKDLINYTKLAVDMNTPLIGSITRLAEQKGMDLFAFIIDRLIARGAGVIVLGKGSANYTKLFMSLSKKYPRKVYVYTGFNDKLAHKIEAGCDMFVMPSRYEPCGLNQIYSIKYGTIPIVRSTGGLDDSIIDFDEDRERSNGFKFKAANEEALYDALSRALEVYKNKDEWKRLVLRAMSYDYSWNRSAREYLKLYGKIMS